MDAVPRRAVQDRQQILAVRWIRRVRLVPAAAKSVGIQSIEIMTCSESEPAATRPGQRTSAGMRRPPSSSSSFMPLNGHVLENRSPPLSLVKTTIVFAALPVVVQRLQDAADVRVHALHHRGVRLL